MRYIECGVNNEFVSGAGQVIGAAGSHHDVALRITFGAMWDGLSMYVTFRDALGENPTVVQILPTNLVLGTERTYDVVVPAAPKAKQGKAMVTVQGYTVVNGTQEANATNTATAYFIVLPSDYAVADDESIDATIAQQLQSEIDEISETVTDARLAAQDAEAWAVGQIEGVDVDDTDTRYENNSKYYAQRADESATEAYGSASAAFGSASSAAGSATAAAGSAATATDRATAAANSATAAAGSAANAATSASNAAGSATAAAQSATTAEGYKNTASQKATDAAGSASAAAGSATAAGTSETNAATSASTASGSATAAATSAATASQKALDSADSAEDSEAWAVGQRGGTDVPSSDETYHNNAKYWAGEAQHAAAGGVSSFNGRSGTVEPQSGDYTAAMVGAIPTTAKGAANGVAELDASGRIPSAQLPSYVDDVLEYETMAQFPATGESGKIYVDKLTNRTYRWGGTEYTEISESLALGETASTAYAGNKGKANADAITELQTNLAAHANNTTIHITAEERAAWNAKPYQTRISFSTSWQGSDPYTQEVTVEDATENSRVDLHPMATTLVQLAEDGVNALYVENNDGTFTANSIGGPPSTSMLMLATVTEVTPAAQIPNTMTLSKSSIEVSNASPSDTFTIDGNYDGVVTVTSSDTSIATASLSGNIVTVTRVESGSATITVNASGGNYTAASKTCSVTCSFIEDGEYGSKVIAGTKTKGSFVRFDGKEWIVTNISGNTYTLMLKKMTETTAFGSSATYSGSTIASKCTTFQNSMSANALSVVNSKTVQSVTAKVWIAQKTDIASWTDSSDPTSSDWSGIRKWTNNDGVYDGVGANFYWCSDPSSAGGVSSIYCNGSFSNLDPSGTFGFRPCIEGTQ